VSAATRAAGPAARLAAGASALSGRVLLVQTAYLGDLALATALLRGLRLGLGPQRLDVLVGRPFGELLAGSGLADEVLRLDKRGQDRGLFGLLRAARRLRGRYDAAVLAVRSVRSVLCVAAAGIRWRVGFSGPAASLLHRRVPFDWGVPHLERLASLAPEVEWARVGLRTHLATTPGERASAEGLLGPAGEDPGRPLVALHPGSAWATKRWPAESFGQTAAWLRREAGARVVVVGSAEDRALGQAAADAAGHGVLNLCGRTDLGSLKAVLQRARLLITNDSGPLHVAEALGTAAVAVFGSTTPSLGFAPRLARSRVVEAAVPCRPCGRHGRRACPEGHFRCMLEVSPAAVAAAALEALAADG
jgi:heptosyltransferase II